MKAFAFSVLGLASPFALSMPINAAAPAQLPAATAIAVSQSGYKDGTYTGASFNAYYGNIQVEVNIKGGAISGFKLLDYPNHTGTSVEINRQALPILAQEVITAQSARVDMVSGATLSSDAFLRSVASALPH